MTLTLLFQIGVVIEDKDFLDSSMNGEPWQAGKFAFTLRCSLWSEHLGISEGEVSNINQTWMFLHSLPSSKLIEILYPLHITPLTYVDQTDSHQLIGDLIC